MTISELPQEGEPRPKRRRLKTETSAFGVGRRESHDASAFYARFAPPEIITDETVAVSPIADVLVHGDSRDLSYLPDNSVGLLTTSPPYYAAKDYELDVSKGHVPENYIEYLLMLRDVFAEGKRVLEPGGRMAVNVANLGRKPYRSLEDDVARILTEDLGLFPMARIVWVKADGAGGSTAFGSFCQPSAPVLRDVTERILVFGKGSPRRAIHWKKRQQMGLPWEATITKDDFLPATLDHWRIQPESAKRVNHPAPFPIELPRRLIELYTWKDDLVLDPFGGVATTAVAAIRTGRRFVCADAERSYLDTAAARLATEGRDVPILSAEELAAA